LQTTIGVFRSEPTAGVGAFRKEIARYPWTQEIVGDCKGLFLECCMRNLRDLSITIVRAISLASGSHLTRMLMSHVYEKTRCGVTRPLFALSFDPAAHDATLPMFSVSVNVTYCRLIEASACSLNTYSTVPKRKRSFNSSHLISQAEKKNVVALYCKRKVGTSSMFTVDIAHSPHSYHETRGQLATFIPRCYCTEINSG